MPTTNDHLVVINQLSLLGGFWQPLTAFFPGQAAAGTGKHAWAPVVPSNTEIVAVVGSVGVSPDGADLIVDVRVNGVSVFATPDARLTIPAGESFASAIPDNKFVNPGDRITVDVDQVGLAGDDLAITVALSPLSGMLGGQP